MDFTKTIIPLAFMGSASIAIDSEPIQAQGIIVNYSANWVCPLIGMVLIVKIEFTAVLSTSRKNVFLVLEHAINSLSHHHAT